MDCPKSADQTADRSANCFWLHENYQVKFLEKSFSKRFCSGFALREICA